MGRCQLKQSLVLLFLSGCPALAGHELLDRDLADGEILYQGHCAACHGRSLEGQPNWRVPNDNGTFPAPPHDETGHTWHHDNQLLFEYVKLGGRGALAERGVNDFNSAMPAFSDALSDSEIWNILAYIRSTWPERMQKTQASRNPKH